MANSIPVGANSIPTTGVTPSPSLVFDAFLRDKSCCRMLICVAGIIYGTYKTFYYDFLPSKSEEENYSLQNKPWQPTRCVVELRYMYVVPKTYPKDPWAIKRVITNQDISSGSLVLSEGEALSQIFQHWPLQVANSVVLGHMRIFVVMCNDNNDDDRPKVYSGPNTYLQKGVDDFSYLLRWTEMASGGGFNPGDELGLYWDAKLGAFRVKKL